MGYLVQGGAKFAGYEFWKKQFVAIAGDQDTAVKYRTAIYLGAASVGESVPCLNPPPPPIFAASFLRADFRENTCTDSLRTSS